MLLELHPFPATLHLTDLQQLAETLLWHHPYELLLLIELRFLAPCWWWSTSFPRWTVFSLCSTLIWVPQSASKGLSKLRFACAQSVVSSKSQSPHSSTLLPTSALVSLSRHQASRCSLLGSVWFPSSWAACPSTLSSACNCAFQFWSAHLLNSVVQPAFSCGANLKQRQMDASAYPCTFLRGQATTCGRETSHLLIFALAQLF